LGKIDVVDPETFLLKEDNRLPLYIESQFGINPKLGLHPNQYIAILSKSLLSGLVVGFSVEYMLGLIRE
jgi:hypothetical protein